MIPQTNPLFLRLVYARKPVESLTNQQRVALAIFRDKLARGVYSFETVPCLCGTRDGLLIARRDRFALPVPTYLCRVCGTMWTNPRMSEQSLDIFYEQDYRPIYVGSPLPPDDFFDGQVQHGKNIYEFVASCVSSIPTFTVFDVGCGAGGCLLPFIEAGCHGYGCDLGGEYLQRGRASGLTLENGDVTTLMGYAPANLVVLCHVLEHLPHPLRSLQKITQLLANEGYVYVELPGIFSIHRTYGDTLLFLQNAHLYHFTLTTLSALMSHAGFRLIKGDEHIRALFQKAARVSDVSTGDQFIRILRYLQLLELVGPFSRSSLLKRGVRFTKRVATTVLGQKIIDTAKTRLGWPHA
jgi:SAM-dependent methyltransferase